MHLYSITAFRHAFIFVCMSNKMLFISHTLVLTLFCLLFLLYNSCCCSFTFTYFNIFQALLATESYRTNFNLTKAINFISEEVQQASLSTEKVYYILPAFSGKTLLDINSNHCEKFIKTGNLTFIP